MIVTAQHCRRDLTTYSLDDECHTCLAFAPLTPLRKGRKGPEGNVSVTVYFQ